MPLSDIQPGYMGYAVIDGSTYRFDSANIGIDQDVIAPDMAEGSRFRMGYALGGALIQGSISGPLTQQSTSELWQKATVHDLEEIPITITYYTGRSLNFNGIINSFSFSVSAGDVATYSIDIMGRPADQGGGGGGGVPQEEILLTWDQIDAFRDNMQSFEITANNNAEAIYVIGQDNLSPVKILPGKLTVTGSVTMFGVPGTITAKDQLSGAITDVLNIYDGMPGMGVIFHGVSPQGQTGPVVFTENFTCVGESS